MTNLLHRLSTDDAGFVVSAELVLVSSIAVLAMIVGLAEVQSGVNQEMEDVGAAVGSINQSYVYRGLASRGKSANAGSFFGDDFDNCDSQWDLIPTRPVDEKEDYGYGRGYGR